MNIRTMTIEDYEPVRALWLSCAGMGLNDLDDSPEGIRAFLRRNPDTCFVAETDGAIVGAIMAGNDGRRGYIYHTAVHPQYRRRGVATALAEAALDALRALGIHKVALVAFRRNEAGNAFWEGLGFHAREDLTYRDKPLANLVRMDT